MNRVLIVKLGAAGDVVRTTTLLERLSGRVTWLTAEKNTPLLKGLKRDVQCLPWKSRGLLRKRTFDLIINLEDSFEVGSYLRTLEFRQLFGAYVDSENEMSYTDDSRCWFDLSIISRYGRERADSLKFENRATYQELVFKGLGFQFSGEPYLLPEPMETELSGDVAIAPEAGAVWPMKNWAYYRELREALQTRSLIVNALPARSSLLEHLCDVRNHRCVVGGDSLPMHLALGTGTRCVSLFTCTSPWEIYDYGVLKKVVSPRLEEFFYQRVSDRRATTAIGVEEVLRTVLQQLEAAATKTAV
jgi:heptosyltransferase-2